MTKYLLIVWIVLLAGRIPMSAARSGSYVNSSKHSIALAVTKANLFSTSISGDPLLGFVSAPPAQEYNMLLPLIEENEDNVNDHFKKQIRGTHQLVTLFSVWISTTSFSLGQVPEASSFSIVPFGDRYLQCRVLRL